MIPPPRQYHGDNEPVTLEMVYGLLLAHIENQDRWRKDVNKAFPLDRNGEPDYDYVGDYHTKIIERAVKMEGAKDRFYERVLGGVLWAVALFALWSSLQGALAYVKDHIK